MIPIILANQLFLYFSLVPRFDAALSLLGHITHSVRPSVCPVPATNSGMKSTTRLKTDMNVASQSSFEARRSKVKVKVTGLLDAQTRNVSVPNGRSQEYITW